ncbi:hypothetical protein A3Q56_02676 [Intoshia linei]|uniref:Uncharacterized protein n=1 Tax=Intoshia linei TaxID=1819745 RepID=A0A177B5P0_9BILA|nr:hypothetical protein A3Q56_02676 [Intoshia linei]
MQNENDLTSSFDLLQQKWGWDKLDWKAVNLLLLKFKWNLIDLMVRISWNICKQFNIIQMQLIKNLYPTMATISGDVNHLRLGKQKYSPLKFYHTQDKSKTSKSISNSILTDYNLNDTFKKIARQQIKRQRSLRNRRACICVFAFLALMASVAGCLIFIEIFRVNVTSLNDRSNVLFFCWKINAIIIGSKCKQLHENGKTALAELVVSDSFFSNNQNTKLNDTKVTEKLSNVINNLNFNKSGNENSNFKINDIYMMKLMDQTFSVYKFPVIFSKDFCNYVNRKFNKTLFYSCKVVQNSHYVEVRLDKKCLKMMILSDGLMPQSKGSELVWVERYEHHTKSYVENRKIKSNKLACKSAATLNVLESKEKNSEIFNDILYSILYKSIETLNIPSYDKVSSNPKKYVDQHHKDSHIAHSDCSGNVFCQIIRGDYDDVLLEYYKNVQNDSEHVYDLKSKLFRSIYYPELINYKDEKFDFNLNNLVRKYLEIVILKNFNYFKDNNLKAHEEAVLFLMDVNAIPETLVPVYQDGKKILNVLSQKCQFYDYWCRLNYEQSLVYYYDPSSSSENVLLDYVKKERLYSDPNWSKLLLILSQYSQNKFILNNEEENKKLNKSRKTAEEDCLWWQFDCNLHNFQPIIPIETIFKNDTNTT